jgi:hypothetical protein
MSPATRGAPAFRTLNSCSASSHAIAVVFQSADSTSPPDAFFRPSSYDAYGHPYDSYSRQDNRIHKRNRDTYNHTRIGKDRSHSHRRNHRRGSRSHRRSQDRTLVNMCIPAKRRDRLKQKLSDYSCALLIFTPPCPPDAANRACTAFNLFGASSELERVQRRGSRWIELSRILLLCNRA